jgi:ribosomal protein S12 methylthiotransferase accessory factor
MRDAWFWFDPDAVLEPVDRVDGLVSRSVAEDLVWCRERLRRAGLSTVPVVDLGHPAIAPAHVVRVMIPGLESNSPFFTGSRARLILLRDMLPRWR